MLLRFHDNKGIICYEFVPEDILSLENVISVFWDVPEMASVCPAPIPTAGSSFLLVFHENVSSHRTVVVQELLV